MSENMYDGMQASRMEVRRPPSRLLQQFEWQTMGTSVKAVAAELRNEENGVDVRRDVKEVESAE